MPEQTPQETKSLHANVSGMHCAHCAMTIEKGLQNKPGITDVKVNLANETLSVAYEPGSIQPAEIDQTVNKLGYQLAAAEAALKVGGMTCAKCVQTIEKQLQKQDGVLEVKVNLATEIAHIRYYPEMISLDEIGRRIESAGYQYLGPEEQTTPADTEKMKTRDRRKKRNRFIVGFIGSALLMVLMFANVSGPVHGTYLLLVVSLPFFVYVSYPIFIAAYHALRNKTLNMDVMYAMGIGVAFIASILGTFQIVLTREYIFYETAVMLASFLMLGRYLEARAKGKTSEAIKKLIGLQPKQARIQQDGHIREIPIEKVKHGDMVVVRPGERIPVDGVVKAGQSYVDEAMITGEPVPKKRKPGEQVVGGTINKNSVLTLSATGVGNDTVLAQIIRLVKAAQGSRPPVQRLADKVVSVFIPVVLAIAFSAFLLWYVILGSSLLFALTTLIAVLVIACPCALGLATPTAVTVGIGRGAELGILIRNGETLEISDKIDTIVFDKTGTLTQGKPQVTDLQAFNGDETELLRLAASLEENSQHPLGQAVVAAARQKQLPLKEVRHFDTVEGKGIRGEIEQKKFVLGSRSFLKEQQVKIIEQQRHQGRALEKKGKTVVYLGDERRVLGLIAIADPLKKSTAAAINALRKAGFQLVMITGDNQHAAQAIAAQIGIDKVIAEVLPKDKAAEVARLQQQGHKVAFVGDGINDAPALAQAEVGIALGSGTDVAMESGAIVLMKDQLTDVVAALQLSRKVMQRIKQNLFWAFAYNTLLIPVAAGLLYPLFRLTFRPELAGLAMALSSVTVVSLSLMLKKYTPPIQKNRRHND